MKHTIKNLKIFIIISVFLCEGYILPRQVKQQTPITPKQNPIICQDVTPALAIEKDQPIPKQEMLSHPSNQERFNDYLAKDQWNECILMGETSVPFLINLLVSNDWTMRQKAVDALVKIGSSSVLSLIEALSAKDSGVRWCAVSALGEIGDTRAIVPLIELLKDKRWYVQKKSVESLIKIGQDAIEPLVKYLDNEGSSTSCVSSTSCNRDVCLLVADALDRLNWKPDNETEQIRYYLAKNRFDKVAEIGQASIQPLICLLNNDCWLVHPQVINTLITIGTPSILPLLELLNEVAPSSKPPVLSAVSQRAAVVLSGIGKPAIGPLITALDNKNVQEHYIAFALGEIGDEKAIEPLISLLKTGQHKVQISAKEALIKIGTSSILYLVNLLGDKEDSVRIISAQALDELQWIPADDTQKAYYYLTKGQFDKAELLGTSATQPLINLLTNSNEINRQKAALILGNLNDKKAITSLTSALSDKNRQVQWNAACSLIRLQALNVQSIVNLLRDEDVNNRELAVTILCKLGDKKAVSLLINALNDKSLSVRWAAINSLGRLGDKMAIEPLIAMFKDEDEQYGQKRISQALVKIGSQTIEPLISGLNHFHYKIRAGAAFTLGELRDKNSVESLAMRIKDENNLVQTAAASALVKIGTVSIEYLIPILNDKDSYVRFISANCLTELGWQPQKSSTSDENSISIGSNTSEGSSTSGIGNIFDKGKTVEELMTALKDKDSSVVALAAQTLWEMGNKQGVEFLITSLQNEQWELAQEALSKIGTIAVEPLINICQNNDNSFIRASIASILGEINDKRASALLITLLNDPIWQVRAAASESLGRLKELSAVQKLITLLNDENPVQIKAIQALGRIGDTGAVQPLIDCLKQEDIQARVILSLSEIGDNRAIQEIIPFFKSNDLEVRCNAAIALGKMGEPQAIEVLITLLDEDNWFIQKNAAQSLLKIGQPAVPYLVKCLTHINKDVRILSVETLEKMNWKPLNSTDVIDYYIAKGQWDKLFEIGHPAVDSLIKILMDKDKEVRRHVILILNEIRDAKAVKPLIAALKYKDTELETANTLVRIGKPAIEPLVSALLYEVPDIQRSSGDILIKMADERTIDLLIASMVNQETSTLTLNVIINSVKANNLLLPSLVQALKNENSNIRLKVANILEELDWKPSTKEQECAYYLAVRDWNQCKRFGDLAIQPLTRFLTTDRDVYIRQNAVLLLGEIGGAQVIAPLILALRDEDIQKQAVNSLIKVGSLSIEPLKQAINDKDWTVKWSVDFVLKMI